MRHEIKQVLLSLIGHKYQIWYADHPYGTWTIPAILSEVRIESMDDMSIRGVKVLLNLGESIEITL